MARTHTYETTFQISNAEVLVVAEFTMTGGCAAHMGSMSYAGHPAESPEIEFTKIEINSTKTKTSDGAWVEAPPWLYDIFQNDEEIFAECCNAADDPYDGYED